MFLIGFDNVYKLLTVKKLKQFIRFLNCCTLYLKKYLSINKLIFVEDAKVNLLLIYLSYSLYQRAFLYFLDDRVFKCTT